jgi:pyrroline-5-carboxylate reductase
MGGALFAGWSAQNLAPSVLLDPTAPPNLARPQDHLVTTPEAIPEKFAPAAIILAIKPQLADTVLPALATKIPQNAVILSILAGKPIARLAHLLGTQNPIVRAMPNTPAAIGQGITAAFADPATTPAQRTLCDTLLTTIGEVVWLDTEAMLDPVTAISGSGPAYLFLLAELLEHIAIERGLPPEIAKKLARKTISGSGALLAASPETAAKLRRAVTSPNGTTEAALKILMAPDAWPATLRAAILAAENRARELAT